MLALHHPEDLMNTDPRYATFRETVRAELVLWNLDDVDAIMLECADEIELDCSEAIRRYKDLENDAKATAGVIQTRIAYPDPHKAERELKTAVYEAGLAVKAKDLAKDAYTEALTEVEKSWNHVNTLCLTEAEKVVPPVSEWRASKCPPLEGSRTNTGWVYEFEVLGEKYALHYTWGPVTRWKIWVDDTEWMTVTGSERDSMLGTKARGAVVTRVKTAIRSKAMGVK